MWHPRRVAAVTMQYSLSQHQPQKIPEHLGNRSGCCSVVHYSVTAERKPKSLHVTQERYSINNNLGFYSLSNEQRQSVDDHRERQNKMFTSSLGRFL